MKTGALRGVAAIAAFCSVTLPLSLLVSAAAILSVVGPARAADDAFAWAPAHAPAVARGRQSGARFGLVGLTEIEVEVDDLYDAANRQALGLAEQRRRSPACGRCSVPLASSTSRSTQRKAERAASPRPRAK